MLKVRDILFAVTATACCLVSEPSLAYDLQPIVMQLSPSGPGSTQSVIITNSHAEPIAIELRAYQRAQNPDGSENRVPEDNDIIISPPQLVIPPGTSQAVRVRWIGDPNPVRELAFRLVSNQLPIKLMSEKRNDFTANVSVNYRYEAALYVTPNDAAPSARITRAEPVLAADGTQMLELEVLNDGTRRASLDTPAVVVTPSGGGEPVTLEGEQLGQLKQLVTLVGSHRTVQIPWPEGMAVGPITAELRTRYLVMK